MFQFLSVKTDKMHHPAHHNDLKQKFVASNPNK